MHKVRGKIKLVQLDEKDYFLSSLLINCNARVPGIMTKAKGRDGLNFLSFN